MILSCCHVFHETCLASFERYIGKEKRFCPLCRFQLYDKNITNIGIVASKRAASTLIASHWRSWSERKRFRRSLRLYYERNVGTDSETELQLRKQFYSKELQYIGGKIEKEIKTKVESVDDILGKSSCALQKNRQAFQELSERKMNAVPLSNNWDTILRAALERNDSGNAECVVCFGKTMLGSFPFGSKNKQKSKSSLVLLSCSHVFHSKCIKSLENFNSMNNDEAQHICPVCRLPYDKLELVL